MKVTVTVEVPAVAKKWLQNYMDCTGTREDFAGVFKSHLIAFLNNIQAEYEDAVKELIESEKRFEDTIPKSPFRS